METKLTDQSQGCGVCGALHGCPITYQEFQKEWVEAGTYCPFFENISEPKPKRKSKMPEQFRDEIAEALDEFIAAVVDCNGELPDCVRRMVAEENKWVSITISAHDATQTVTMLFALDNCKKWWLEPAAPITPHDLATVRRSRLYFQALEGE